MKTTFFDSKGRYLTFKERYFLKEGVEDYINYLRKQGKNIDDGIVLEIITLDPTYNPERPDVLGKYSKWLINQYLKSSEILDFETGVSSSLKVFDKFKKEMGISDINQFKNFKDLINKTEPFKDKDPEQSKRQLKLNLKGQSEKVYEDENWLLVIPKTWEASKFYGANTRWCTASEKSCRDFDDYSKKGDLLIIIDKKNNRKFQIHKQSKSFMDEVDNKVDIPDFEYLDYNLPEEAKIEISERLDIQGFYSEVSGEPDFVTVWIDDLWPYFEGNFQDFIDYLSDSVYLKKEEAYRGIKDYIYTHYNTEEEDFSMDDLIEDIKNSDYSNFIQNPKKHKLSSVAEILGYPVEEEFPLHLLPEEFKNKILNKLREEDSFIDSFFERYIY